MNHRYLYKLVDANTGQSMWRWFARAYEVGKTYAGVVAGQERQLYVAELINIV